MSNHLQPRIHQDNDVLGIVVKGNLQPNLQVSLPTLTQLLGTAIAAPACMQSCQM